MRKLPRKKSYFDFGKLLDSIPHFLTKDGKWYYVRPGKKPVEIKVHGKNVRSK